MDSSAQRNGQSAALDDLIALTEEMAAIVRAGIPLESGLSSAAQDLARKPSKLTAALAQRMESGDTLVQALRASPEVFPETYVAVVNAGLRAGRLSAALESLATSSRRASEMRRLTRASLIYPLFIALMAYGLFAYSITSFQPTIATAYTAFEQSPSKLNAALVHLGQSAVVWLPWIPALLLAVVILWWYRSTRATAGHGVLAKFSPIGQMAHVGRLTTFADLLALLIENEVPLAPAIRLAGDATGERGIRMASRELASQIERGATSTQINQDNSSIGLPPLLYWQLTGSGGRTALAESLRTTAEAYRRRALRIDDWLQLYLPLTLLVGIGGTCVAMYALTMLGPWYEMLQNLGSGAR
jgi:type II secretory pathway component PulF